jgi:anti-sigma B factor antagonist
MSQESDSVIQSHRMQDDAMIVKLEGDVDLQRSLAFQQEMTDLLGKDCNRLVFDLSDVPYMDSSGVASLVKVLSRCRKQDVEMALAGMNPRVRGIFEITRLDKVFRMFDSVDEALEQV